MSLGLSLETLIRWNIIWIGNFYTINSVANAIAGGIAGWMVRWVTLHFTSNHGSSLNELTMFHGLLMIFTLIMGITFGGLGNYVFLFITNIWLEIIYGILNILS